MRNQCVYVLHNNSKTKNTTFDYIAMTMIVNSE